MTMHAEVIRPIYEMPGHRRYGPCRRLWMMLEQLFADRGGVRALEIAIAANGDRMNRAVPRWDEHLDWLMDCGQSEAPAQRIVMMQMLTAAQWLS